MHKQEFITQDNLIKFVNQNYSNCDLLTKNKEQSEMKKRKDNRYFKIKQVNGKKYYIYGKTINELNDNLRALNKQIKQQGKSVNATPLSLNKWLKDWYGLYKKPFVKENTQQDIENILFNHLKSFGNIELKKITTANLQAWLNKLENNRTKEKIILYLKPALQKAFALHKIKNNPFEDIHVGKKLNNKRRPFTYDEQVKVLSRLENEEIKPIILIYLLTGLRKHELNFKSILNDIENNVLKAINLKQHDTKVHYKYIDLTQGTVELIKKNFEVFKNNTANSVYRKFQKILKELRIDGALHTLRYTFVTNHFYLGTPDKIVSEWCGHSTIVITKDIYTQIDRTISKEKIKLLYNNLYYNFD